MPDKNPFSPNSGLAFLTGLTSSMMGSFKENYDREREDERHAKDTDFQLLMAALEHLKPGLTPSQAQNILSRAVDIYKPKGHGGIKDKLGELFGRGPGYEPQSGKILGEMPKAKVDVGTVTGSQEPSKLGDVTLPPPPEMPYKTQEKTYRELDQEDVANKYGLQLQKQMAMEEQRQSNRLEMQEQKNKDIISRVRELYKYKTDLDAEKDLLKRAALYDPSNPRNPDAMVRAAQDLQQEADVKKQYMQTRIEYQKGRLTQIDESLRLAKERIEIARKGAGSKAANFNNDPQVKGAWVKVNQYLQQGKSLRTQASLRYADGDETGAQKLIDQAEIVERSAQQVIDGIEQRVNSLHSGVPVGGGSSRRSGAKLTRDEILQAGGTEADVEEARRKGVLAP